MISLDQALGVIHDLIDRLNDGIRRKASILDGQIHAAAGCDHAGSDQAGCLKLTVDQQTGAFGEDIVMINSGRAACQKQFAERGQRAVMHCLLVEILPYFIEVFQPRE